MTNSCIYALKMNKYIINITTGTQIGHVITSKLLKLSFSSSFISIIFTKKIPREGRFVKSHNLFYRLSYYIRELVF